MTIFLTQKTEGEGLILVYCFWVFSPWSLGPCAWAEYLWQPEYVGAEFLHLIRNRKEKAKDRGRGGAKGKERNRNRRKWWWWGEESGI